MKTYNKTVLIIIGIFIIYTSILTIYIYYSFSNYEFVDFYRRLSTRVEFIKEELEKGNHLAFNLLEKLPDQKDYIIELRNKENINPSIPEKIIEQTLKRSSYEYNNRDLFYSSTIHRTHDKVYIVIVSAKNTSYSMHIKYLRNLFIGTILFSVLLMVFVAILVHNTLIKPVSKVIKEVNQISSDNLHLRLNVHERKDKSPINELGYTFNGMLNRLETAFETQKNFISNASHELNTPLTSIIGRAELVLSKKRNVEEYEKALHNILSEAENLENKTKALLLLARTGFDGKSQKFGKVRIDEVLLNVKDNLQKINSNYKIKLDFSMLPENPTMLKIKGNEQLLHLAISNIVGNSCKYSKNHEAAMALGASDNSIIIVIKDNGIGIPLADIDYIFDPYFRASNTLNFKGYGIGLPLSLNIIKMHNGELFIKSKENIGTTVQIVLPYDNYDI